MLFTAWFQYSSRAKAHIYVDLTKMEVSILHPVNEEQIDRAQLEAVRNLCDQLSEKLPVDKARDSSCDADKSIIREAKNTFRSTMSVMCTHVPTYSESLQQHRTRNPNRSEHNEVDILALGIPVEWSAPTDGQVFRTECTATDYATITRS